VFFENRRTVFSLAKEAIGTVLTPKRRVEEIESIGGRVGI
jgi:hypothetical protein